MNSLTNRLCARPYAVPVCVLALAACAQLSAAVMVCKDETPEQQKLKFEVFRAQRQALERQRQAIFQKQTASPPAIHQVAQPSAPAAIQQAAQPCAPAATIPPGLAQPENLDNNTTCMMWLYVFCFLALTGFVLYEYKKT